MSRRGFTLSKRLVVPVLVGIGLLNGCSVEKDFAVPADRQGIQEFAAIYRGFTHRNKRSPKMLKELQVKGQGYPNAMEMLNSGDLVVKWGLSVPTDGEGGAVVLAYEKNVSKEGGNVLMQDGKTIKKMTADEFNSASK